jgi:aminomethyltransferase
VVDDLYAYRLGPAEYLLIINASRIEPDVRWLRSQLAASEFAKSARLEDLSDTTAALAVQGPRAPEIMSRALPGKSTGGTEVGTLDDLKKNQIARFSFDGKDLWISRTGYTGEDGFEIVAPGVIIESVWNRILEMGKPLGLKPAGLGARDTLRTEVCYPLYGHELDENTTPIEAGVGFFVALDKGDFVGRAALAAQKSGGTSKKLVAFRMTDRSAPPRPEYAIWRPGAEPAQIGRVVSGTQSPTLGAGIGLGYVPPEFAKPQTPLEIEIRGRRAAAVVVPKPFYRKPD